MSMGVLEFSSGGDRCAARHYEARSDMLRSGSGVPCIVMGHGFGATVDCGLDGFATGLAKAGFSVLLFDYRGFGASGGFPRQVVDVVAQQRDFRAALTAARDLPGVDPARLVAWGASLGGAHVFHLAAGDPSLAAAVALTPAVDGAVATWRILRREGPAPLGRALARSGADVVARMRGRAPVTLATVGPPGSTAAVTAPGAMESFKEIAGPTWRNEVAARSLLQIPSYRPGRSAAAIACPILIQIADFDSTVPVEPIRAAARRAPRAEVRHYPGDHFDLYTGRRFHALALSHQIQFLTRHLSPASALTEAAAG